MLVLPVDPVDAFNLERGSEHAVEVVLAVYPPYIKGLRRVLRWSRRMKVN